jgi:hypothetical protein
MKKTKFALNEGGAITPGMQMTFRNGFSISIQWHYGSYCSNRDVGPFLGTESMDVEQYKKDIHESSDAEIAVMDPQGEMVWLSDYDQVVGWLLPDEVAEYMSRVSNLRYDPLTGELLDPDELFKTPWKEEDDEDEDA